MARIALLSICDRNAHGLRMMSSSLRRSGHECHIVFLKRYGRSPSVEAEPDDYPWIGIDTRGREFRYAHGSPITDRELDLLRGLLERIRPDAIGMSVTTPLRKRITAGVKACRRLSPARPWLEEKSSTVRIHSWHGVSWRWHCRTSAR